jgi:hypothetical protein
MGLICATPTHPAYYVNRILKAAKPGDLPVHLPSKSELLVNLNGESAWACDSRALLRQADEVE